MIKCVSIFSGAGGLDIGAKQAGAKITACIDNDNDSIETLRLNNDNPTIEIINDDIQNINFKKWNNTDDNILIGGPPCQPFSKNGYWIKNDNRLIENDPRNMLGQYLRAVKEMLPNGFLFENVASILHPSNRPVFEKFLLEAKSIGYACTMYKANSADFGVPQKRKRVFVFGILGSKSKIPKPIPNYSDYTKNNFDDNLPPYKGVGSFIRNFEGKKYYEPQEDASQGTYFNELVNVPMGKNYIELSKIKDYSGKTFKSGGRFWNFLYKLHPELPSITIAAQPGPWVGPFHWSNRRLRVPEIAAIQTFPLDFKFFGNRRSIQKQIGNAVPPMLAKKMVSHLLEHLS